MTAANPPGKDDVMPGITVPGGAQPVDPAEIDAALADLDPDTAVGGDDPAEDPGPAA